MARSYIGCFQVVIHDVNKALSLQSQYSAKSIHYWSIAQLLTIPSSTLPDTTTLLHMQISKLLWTATDFEPQIQRVWLVQFQSQPHSQAIPSR